MESREMAPFRFVELRIVSDVMEKAAFVFCSTQTGRKYVPKIAICHPQYGDEARKVTRVHATSLHPSDNSVKRCK